MITFSYTITLQLQTTLRDIDALRARILTYPMPPKTEQKLAWEATAIRIWATLALSGRKVPSREIATILSHPVKPTRALQTIYAIRDIYTAIHTNWRGNPKPLTSSGWEDLFPNSILHTVPAELFSYLQTESEHPVIQAGLAHAYIFMESREEDADITARLMHYLLLAKYGYDIRGLAAPEQAWQHDESTYHKLAGASRTAPNLNLWLEFIVDSMHDHLGTLYKNISTTHFHIEFPPAFWNLTERQKEIMQYLAPPHATITNRIAKKRFHISPITASRDLAKLTTLGLIYPHGKGRSIYYTKI